MELKRVVFVVALAYGAMALGHTFPAIRRFLELFRRVPPEDRTPDRLPDRGLEEVWGDVGPWPRTQKLTRTLKAPTRRELRFLGRGR